MNLQLTNKTSMWFIKEANLYLTFLAPSTTIDLSKLSNEHKKQIVQAIHNGLISSTNPIELLEGKPITISEPKLETPLAAMTAENQLLEQRCLQLLEGKLIEVIKTIGGSEDVRLLRCMLKLEISSKNRKRIVEVLNQRIDHINSLVLKNISENADPTQKEEVIKDAVEKLSRSMQVLVSDEKLIVINKTKEHL